MRRKQNIQDTFKSVVPELTAGIWSVGYSGHTDESGRLSDYGTPTGYLNQILNITNITNITDQYVPGTTNLVMNDVYVYYSIVTTGGTLVSTGVTSIYDYTVPTTTTTTAAPTTTTTTAAPTTTTTTTAATTTTTTT